MDFGQALLLSIVEGITEFLPISSTGHLILASKLLGVAQSEFIKTFEISIQLGAILSVVFLYWKRLLREWEVLKRVIWVFIPTGILGFLLYKIVKTLLLGNLMVTVWALIIGGIAIIFLEKYFKKAAGNSKIQDLSLSDALFLGVIQTISVIPGVSRSASTIFGGMFFKLSRKEATELSFLAALPVMGAATGYDLMRNMGNFGGEQVEILLFGMASSFLAAVIAIKWLLKFIQTHDFTYFGIYRIVIGVIFLLFIH